MNNQKATRSVFTPTQIFSRLRFRPVLRILFAVAFCLAIFQTQAAAQLSGTRNIPGDYADLSAAITALNTQGVGIGGVTFNVTAAQTAPTGGYIIGGTGSLVLTTSSAATPIVFTGNGNTVTAFGGQTAGNINDAVFKLVGADFVTIQGFAIQENAANTTITPATSNNATEFGIGLFYVTTTDGAQNNTIQNNTITLNRAYANTFCIFSSTRAALSALGTTADATTQAGTNSNTKIYTNNLSNANYAIVFLGSSVSSPQETGTDIGGLSTTTGNTITNVATGTATLSTYITLTGNNYAIFLNHQINDNISFNSITTATPTNTTVTVGGFLKNYSVTQPTGTITTNINNNTVTVNSAPTTGANIGINNQGLTALSTATHNINNNTILNSAITGAAATSASITGLTNLSAPGTLNMNNNVVRGLTSTSTTGQVVGISNSGAVVNAINITNNQFGNASGGFFSTSTATSGAAFGISTSGGAATCVLTITGNDIRGITYNTAATAAQTYIVNSAATLSQNISSNTFTNLNVNTTGNVTFISNSVTAPAGGSKTINSNSIVTAFNKGGAGGTIALYNDGGSSVATAGIQNNNNNFSNITVTGATAITGWFNNDGTGGTPTKTITGNTFNNWTGGTSAITALQSNFGNPASLSNNTITNISGQSTVTGLSVGSSGTVSALNIANNTVTGLSSTGGGGAVTGISNAVASTTNANINANTVNNLSSTSTTGTVAGITTSASANIFSNTINTLSCVGTTSGVTNGIGVSAGTTVNVFKNKIYDLSTSGAFTTTPGVNGIVLSGSASSATVTVYNNLIGDLKAPTAASTDAIRGLSVTATGTTSTYNIYYNTLLLTATSAGANFGTTGIFHTINTLSSTATLNLRNNIIVNNSTPAGTGLTVAYRRSGGAASNLANYASTSNNNDFYAGTPGASNLIYADGTSTAQTIAAYRSGAFTAGTIAPRDSASFSENPNFVSTTGASTTFLHINTSIGTQIESGGSAISGITDDFDGDARNASTPDVGADEFTGIGIDLSPPVISYALLGNGGVGASQAFSNVVVTDATGVNTTSGTRPRVYYKKTCDANNVFNDNTNATVGWKFAQATGSGGSPFSFTIDYSLLPACSGGSGAGVVAAGDVIQYFVVAQDTVSPTPNVGINSGTFAATPSSVALTSAAFPIGGTINSYNIVASFSGTRTVCASGCDFTSLTGAAPGGIFASINGAVVTANVNIEIAGDLTEDGTNGLNPVASPFVVRIYPTGLARNITSTSGITTTSIIRLNAADNVIIDGSIGGTGTDRSLTITSVSATPQAVVWLQNNGTDGATGNTVRNLNVVGNSNTTTAIGIGTGSATVSASSLGTNNNSNTIQNNNISKVTTGIFSQGASATAKNTGNIITQNLMNAASPNNLLQGGIRVGFEEGISITQNSIANTLSTATTFGITLGTLPGNTFTNFTGNEVTGATVARNMIDGIVRSGDGTAFGIGVASVTSVGANANTIANNFISGVRSTSATPSDFPSGILLGGGTTGSTRVYFNSVSMNATSSGAAVCSSSSPCFGIVVGGTNPTVDLRNNVFSNRAVSSTGKTYAIGFAYAAPFTNLTMTRNVFFSNSANFAVTGGLAGTDQTFAGLETATGTTGNISGDPRFIDPVANLHIDTTIATPVESAGVTISGITTDIDGDTRNASTPDIGADEGTFIAPVTNDVQATAFIDPTNGGSKIAGTAFAPQASFTNNGTANQTNVPVRYRICTDGTCGTVLYNQTTTLATLNSGATATATFANATLSAGSYSIKAKAELVGDTVSSNDEITGTLTVLAPLSGSYNVPGDYASLTNAGGIFDALNSVGASSAITINIAANLTAETGAISLNPVAGGFAVTIQPGAGPIPDPASPQAVRTISGSATTALINFNGADNVTLNGSANSNTLTLRNTSATTGAVIQLTNDASGNTITNCTIEGGNTNTSSALVLLGTGTTTGNDNNFITNNIIRDRTDVAGVPANLIASINASTTATNSSNTISGNTLINFTSNGFATSTGLTSDNWTITNNDISQTASRTTQQIGISLGGMTGTNLVSGNSIHGLTSNSSSGTAGILVGNTQNLTISRNRIYDFQTTATATGAIVGVEFDGASGGTPSVTLANNMISLAPTIAAAQVITGIFDFGFSGNIFTANYNSVYVGGTASGSSSSWAMRRGISAPTTYTAQNNIIFNNRTGGTGNHFAGGDQSAASGGFVSNYNFFAGTGATAANFMDYGTSSAGTAVSFATWRTGPPTRDANSIADIAANYTVSNIFVNATAGDLHLLPTATQVIGAGTPVGSVTVDYDNDPRPASAPDIGADELVQATGGSIAAGTYYNVLAGNGDALGGNVTVTNQLNLTGILTGGSNTLTLGCNTTVTGAGTSAYVNGAVAKQYCSTGSFSFPVGVGGYSPVTINATTLPAGTTTKTVTPTQAPMPGVTDATRSINRYWNLTTTAAAGTYAADLTFQIVTGVDEGSNFSIGTANVLRRNSDNTINEITASSRTANTVTVNNINAFSLWTLANANAAPTLAVVKEFNAYRFGTANLVQWQSSYETRNLGFRVYREENGARREIAPNIIAGSALLTGAETQLTAGKSYGYWDKTGTANSVYWVEDIDLNGTTSLHGPIRLTTADNRLANVTDSATLNELRADGTGAIEQQLIAKALRTSAARPEVGSDAWQRQLALAGSAAVKLQVRENGWYRVSGSQLAAAGLPVNAEAKFLQLYVNGVQVPMVVRTAEGNTEGGLGAGGVVEFYGVGQDTRESDSSVYWLIAGNGNGQRIGAPVRVAPDNTEGAVAGPKAGGQGAAGSFAYTVERKDRSIYVPAILNGDVENFYGAVVSSTAVDQALTVSNLDTTATGAASLSVALQGATASAHQVTVSLNGTQLGIVSFANQERKVTRFDVPAGSLREGVNTVALRGLNGAADVSLTEYLRLTYAHRYAADNNRLLLASGNRQSVTVNGFTTDRVRVFDLTEPNRSFEVAATSRAANGGGFEVTIPSNLNSRQLLAISDDQALTPVSITANEPSAWTRTASAADFVIIAPARFRAAAQPLANLRNSQGLTTAVVALEDIYDEWNGGAANTAAISGFLNYARQNWATQPRYVLYLGDASYDPRNYLGNGATDIVPTGFIETPDFETASDEALTDTDNDGIGELASGRMPARTVAEAQAMINRAVNFTAFNGGAVLVADKPDGYDFAGVNQTVRGMLPSNMAATVINRQGQTDEAVRSQINTAWNAGPSVVQYAGHAGPESWTGAPLFNVADALALNNGNRLPLLIGMTCMNGYLQDPNGLSLAEALMQSPNGGAIAVWGSSGLTFPAGQVPMDYALIQALYGAGQSPRLGDAVRTAKTQTGDALVRRTWLLFGDPTLRIR